MWCCSQVCRKPHSVRVWDNRVLYSIVWNSHLFHGTSGRNWGTQLQWLPLFQQTCVECRRTQWGQLLLVYWTWGWSTGNCGQSHTMCAEWDRVPSPLPPSKSPTPFSPVQEPGREVKRDAGYTRCAPVALQILFGRSKPTLHRHLLATGGVITLFPSLAAVSTLPTAVSTSRHQSHSWHFLVQLVSQ